MKASNKLMMMTAVGLMLGFSSCNVNDDTEENRPSKVVYFSGDIDRQAVPDATDVPESRAAGTAWATNDAIGIFMVQNATTTLSLNATNKQYKTVSGNGTFTPVTGDEIYYPQTGKVDFIAYYPWTTGYTLPTAINVQIGTTQTTASQAGFDLLWAKATGTSNAGYDKFNTSAVALNFSHKLAKMVMNVKADANIGTTDLSAMSVSISGMNTKNTFNLATGALGTANTAAAITPAKISTATSFHASYDAIIMPGTYATDAVQVVFTLNSEPYTWKLKATDATFTAGNEYTYAVTLTRTGIQVTGSITAWTANNKGAIQAD